MSIYSYAFTVNTIKRCTDIIESFTAVLVHNLTGTASLWWSVGCWLALMMLLLSYRGRARTNYFTCSMRLRGRNFSTPALDTVLEPVDNVIPITREINVIERGIMAASLCCAESWTRVILVHLSADMKFPHWSAAPRWLLVLGRGRELCNTGSLGIVLWYPAG